MDMGPNVTKDYRYLLDAFPGNVIPDRYASLLKQIEVILDSMGLTNEDVMINTELLDFVVLDYFADIHRLKRFHGIELANVQKIYAYTFFWFLRKKPLQQKKALSENLLFLNEKVAMCMLIPKLFVELGLSYPDKPDEAKRMMKGFRELLYYNIKYRTFTQQSLELMIQAFMAGCHMNITQGEGA